MAWTTSSPFAATMSPTEFRSVPRLWRRRGRPRLPRSELPDLRHYYPGSQRPPRHLLRRSRTCRLPSSSLKEPSPPGHQETLPAVLVTNFNGRPLAAPSPSTSRWSTPFAPPRRAPTMSSLTAQLRPSFGVVGPLWSDGMGPTRLCSRRLRSHTQ